MVSWRIVLATTFKSPNDLPKHHHGQGERPDRRTKGIVLALFKEMLLETAIADYIGKSKPSAHNFLWSHQHETLKKWLGGLELSLSHKYADYFDTTPPVIIPPGSSATFWNYQSVSAAFNNLCKIAKIWCTIRWRPFRWWRQKTTMSVICGRMITSLGPFLIGKAWCFPMRNGFASTVAPASCTTGIIWEQNRGFSQWTNKGEKRLCCGPLVRTVDYQIFV